MNKDITVTKADGTTEPFDEGKLRTSLEQAGANEETINTIVDHIIEKELQPGLKTESIYSHARALLKQAGGATAARYSLRQALSDLGPTGYPFEHFIARIFETQGYEVDVGVVLDGKCTTHEVDIVGKSDSGFIIGEAKFHNRRGVTSDVKTALYVQARLDDLHETDFGNINTTNEKIRRLLITNTKFTRKAIEYGECAGLELIGWNHPETENLQDMIEEANLQPITTLTSLSTNDKKGLVDNELVLCKNLRENREALEEIGMDNKRIDDVMEEVQELCHL